MYKLFFDLCKILLCARDIQCGLDRFQVGDIIFRFFAELGEGFKGPFLLIVFAKITLGVFLGRLCRIQGDDNGLVCVVIQRLQLLFPFF